MAISGISSGFSNLNVTVNPQEQAQKLLKQMDTDADGKVSKQEFTTFGEQMKTKGGANKPAPPSGDQMFAQADQGGDGSLSVDDLSALLAQHETNAAAHGGPPPGGPPPGGPPRGGPAGKDGASASATDSATSSEPADADHDGTVSAMEKLIYALSHPSGTSESAS